MMTTPAFTKDDFSVFHIDGLAPRMAAIQDMIQPKFNQIGQQLTSDLSAVLGEEMFLHIARHARRKINPPNDTWLAVANNKRGYKQHPHFQVGLFDDRLFIWLAFIYELPRKSAIADTFLRERDLLDRLIPGHYDISLDHMKKTAEPWEAIDSAEALTRFRDVKKAEFLIGRQLLSNDPVLQDGEALYHVIWETIQTLIPVYKLAQQA